MKPEGSERLFGQPRVVVLSFGETQRRSGNTYRRYAVRGYRFHARRGQSSWKLACRLASIAREGLQL